MKPEDKERLLALVEAHQPVTAARVCELWNGSGGPELTVQETNDWLSKWRTNYPKRIVRSGDRYSVVDLSD